jgi:ABC-type Mn2+/Zn2+ transport system ATPase subunit
MVSLTRAWPPSGKRVEISTRADLALRFSGVWAAYPGARDPVLQDVSIDVPRGALVAVLGPNGGGKSTLLNVALGLLLPLRGDVCLLSGAAPRAARSRVGYVPQRELVDWRFPVTVFDVALMGRYGRLGFFRRPGRADRAVVRDALSRVGMLALANRQIGELSGGQQQRVFLARALVSEPELLLLDEPMSGVDALTERDMLDLLDRLRGQGATVIMTTHDLSCAADRFDLVLFLNRTVIAYGPPVEVFTEEHLQRAYGGHRVLVQVGNRFLAVEGGAHHQANDPSRDWERPLTG